MTADRLLALYERVAESPDAIARLRRFVLDLAVRGKLVEQDPADEPASELLRGIAKEKARLVKAGEIRTPKPILPISGEDIPFTVPRGWHLTRLGAVIDLISGQHLQPPEYSKSADYGVPYITGPADFSDSGLCISKYALVRKAVARKGQLLLTVKGSGVGKTTICDLREVAISRQLMALTPINWDLGFLRLVTHRLAERLQEQARSLIPGIAREDVERFTFPLPPLAEQHRIVAKVDELIALCGRLEAARTAREAKRDRLTTASLARLTAPDTDAETFRTHARFALDALPALTTRPDQIKTLRQTILNLAVRGKLVKQDPADEPASELLKRIAKKISAYSRANRIGQTQVEPIPDDNLPFSAPITWQWTRLCALFKVITDGDHQPPPKADKGVAFLTITNVTTGRLDFTGCRLVPEAYFKSLAPYRTPAKGDILYTVVGATYGRPALVETDRDFCVQRHIAIFKPVEAVNLRFLVTLLASPLIYDQATRSATGTAQPTIALRPLRNFVAPLPPLAEQHRIVAKVDALMALCDRLEASLATADTTRRHLLEALLLEALAPATEALEAAE